MRAFLALPLPDEIRRSLTMVQQELACSGADIKWVEPQNLHVTLQFLGEITDKQRRAIVQLLGEAARNETVFTLGLDRIGAFPSLLSPRVVWIGLGQGKERAIRLVERLKQGVGVLGLGKEDSPAGSQAQAERAFAAHVTLGRVRTPRQKAELVRALRDCAWNSPAPWTVISLTLYQSVLSSSGPIYSVLAEVPLKTL